VAGSNGPYLSVSQLERSRSPKDPLKTDPDLLFYLHTLSNPPWYVPTLRAYWPMGKFQSSSWTNYVPTDPSFWGARGGKVPVCHFYPPSLPSPLSLSLSLFKWSKVTTKVKFDTPQKVHGKNIQHATWYLLAPWETPTCHWLSSKPRTSIGTYVPTYLLTWKLGRWWQITNSKISYPPGR
jgi:hypothetical protein